MLVRRSPQSVARRQRLNPRGIALLVALSALAGCSGGGGTAGSIGVSCTNAAGVADADVLCLASCNLGCSSTGCARSDIAQNEIVILQFSEPVDPLTVNTSSIRFRTASGDQPVGEFFVNGNQVEFSPTLAISGGQTFFGFAAGETYTMTIVGGANEPQVVRSTSGKPFERTLVCTLVSSRGIIDLNGVAPRAEMAVPPPAQLASAPRNTQIVLEFNEMIDATPFLSGTQSPVAFAVRRNRETTAGSGVYECNPNSAPQVLGGTQTLTFDAGRNRSILTFQPVQILPGNVCVEVTVTDGVTDLSGRPAQPQTLSFRTEVVPLVEQTVPEDFNDEQQLDVDGSAATWAGGNANFLPIGGDARHGDFSIGLAVDQNQTVEGKRLFHLRADNTTIPAANTTTGAAIQISDGRFYFRSFVLPADVRLRIVSETPNVVPIITVAGKVDILGVIDVAGTSITVVPTIPSGSVAPGQAGAAAGIGGGAGGKGGDRLAAPGAGVGPVNSGGAGQPASLRPNHAYSSSTNLSGGRGSSIFPVNGLYTSVLFGGTGSQAYSPMAAAGGGGGGSFEPGANGRVVSNNHPDFGLTGVSWTGSTATTLTVANATWIPNRYAGRTLTLGVPPNQQTYTVVSNTADTITVSAPWSGGVPFTPTFSVTTGSAPNLSYMGPLAPGGNAVQLFPFPVTGALRASEHFLVGGGGGGGAGTQPALTLNVQSLQWYSPGLGGAGGGGAVALRAGRSLRVGPAARILAAGGNAANVTGTGLGGSAPGGGGGGGSIVLQCGRDDAQAVDLTGLLDVRGGAGGSFNRSAGGAPPLGASIQIQGGNGGNGIVRLEAPTQPSLAALATMQPPASANNVGALSERDTLVSCTSKFYSTGQVFVPEFARYEIYGSLDGAPFVLSDDPAISTQAATAGAPVRVKFQGVQLDLSSGEPLTLGLWRDSVRSSSTPPMTGIDADAFANGFRFQLLADFTTGTNITVDRLVVVYRL